MVRGRDLRRLLSPRDQTILLLAARGGAETVRHGMRLRSREEAEREVERVRRRVERIARARARRPAPPMRPSRSSRLDDAHERVLAAVRDRGPIRQADAREAAGVSAARMRMVVDVLVREGLVTVGEHVAGSPLLMTPEQAWRRSRRPRRALAAVVGA